jgi:predicted RNA-binding protein with PUA-like domain
MTVDTAFDESHPYFDPKSDKSNPKWYMVRTDFDLAYRSGIRTTNVITFYLGKG